MLDLKVLMLNVNQGHNPELMEVCHTLWEYAEYTDRVRKYAKEQPIAEAVERAITECIREGILKEFLEKNRREAKNVSIYEYDQEKHIRQEREEAWEAGEKAGREAGEKAGWEAGEKAGREAGWEAGEKAGEYKGEYSGKNNIEFVFKDSNGIYYKYQWIDDSSDVFSLKTGDNLSNLYFKDKDWPVKDVVFEITVNLASMRWSFIEKTEPTE